MVRPAPIIGDWLTVRPGQTYGSADVAALFGVKETTVMTWARTGKVRALPRMSARQPFRFLGSELLRLLGDQAGELTPPSETQAERQARGANALERVRALVRKK